MKGVPGRDGERWTQKGGLVGTGPSPRGVSSAPTAALPATSTLVANSRGGSEEAGLSTESVPRPRRPAAPSRAPSPPRLHFPSSPWISPSLAPCTRCEGPCVSDFTTLVPFCFPE